MKVLIVCSGNSGKSSFITQQAEAIISRGIKVDYYRIKGKGIIGYLKNLNSLKNKIKESECDIIHAHYGLSGLLGCMQNIKPVVITFHGSDIYLNVINRFFSFLASRFSSKNIFVHPNQIRKVPFSKLKSEIIPCGVDIKSFTQIDKQEARRYMNLNSNNLYVLFSSSFDNKVKNYKLAKEIVNRSKQEINLIELKDFSMKEVNFLLNAVDLLLITSVRETGPMIVKEAMACGCPVVSNDVGDVKHVIKNIDGCHIITSNKTDDFVIAINKCIKNNIRTKGRQRIIDLNLDTISIAKKIIALYNKI